MLTGAVLTQSVYEREREVQQEQLDRLYWENDNLSQHNAMYEYRLNMTQSIILPTKIFPTMFP